MITKAIIADLEGKEKGIRQHMYLLSHTYFLKYSTFVHYYFIILCYSMSICQCGSTWVSLLTTKQRNSHFLLK